MRRNRDMVHAFERPVLGLIQLSAPGAPLPFAEASPIIGEGSALSWNPVDFSAESSGGVECLKTRLMHTTSAKILSIYPRHSSVDEHPGAHEGVALAYQGDVLELWLAGAPAWSCPNLFLQCQVNSRILDGRLARCITYWFSAQAVGWRMKNTALREGQMS
jgi:hypothetical protein